MSQSRLNIKDKKRIVIKVGTSTVIHENGKVNLYRMERLARAICDISNLGKEVVLVSSGAIGVGTERLSLKERPRDIKKKQAAAAVGQVVLMNMYQKFFSDYEYQIAQILVTKHILTDPLMNFNGKNTFEELFEMGVIPIVNENDTVSTEEIEFGDNDTLSSIVASLIDADLLILLSDIDGLYSDDPNKNSDAVLIDEIKSIDDVVEKCAKESSSKIGTGGMITKITAAKIATDRNIDVIIANGKDPKIINEILKGKTIGTLFVGRK